MDTWARVLEAVPSRGSAAAEHTASSAPFWLPKLVVADQSRSGQAAVPCEYSEHRAPRAPSNHENHNDITANWERIITIPGALNPSNPSKHGYGPRRRTDRVKPSNPAVPISGGSGHAEASASVAHATHEQTYRGVALSWGWPGGSAPVRMRGAIGKRRAGGRSSGNG